MYLLDTCAFIWSIQDDERLSHIVRKILAGNEPVFISQATLWEIAIKKSTGKLDVKETTFELEDLCAVQDIGILPLESKYFERIQKLPLIHRDPFDRIIIATAFEEDLILLTCDENIIKYNEVKCLW